jgi:hypothetical protein
MIAQGAAVGTRLTREAFAYSAGEQNFKLHGFSLSIAKSKAVRPAARKKVFVFRRWRLAVGSAAGSMADWQFSSGCSFVI